MNTQTCSISITHFHHSFLILAPSTLLRVHTPDRAPFLCGITAKLLDVVVFILVSIFLHVNNSLIHPNPKQFPEAQL